MPPALMATASGKPASRRPFKVMKDRPWLALASNSWKGMPRRVWGPWGILANPSFSLRSSPPATAASKDWAGPMLAALERSTKVGAACAGRVPAAKAARRRKGTGSSRRIVGILQLLVLVILGDDLDHFLGLVHDVEKIRVPRVDVAAVAQDGPLDPVDHALPKLLVDQDDG